MKASLGVLLRGATPGLQINEDIAEPGDLMFRHACALGPRRHCLEAARLALPVGPLARLDQVEEPGGVGSQARGGRGTGGGNKEHEPCGRLEAVEQLRKNAA
jgi:hypothetical protein